MAADDTQAPVRVPVDELRELFLFEGLPDEKLAWLSERGQERRFTGRDTVYTYGEPATCFLVLLEGELQLWSRSGDEDILVSTTSKPGVYGGATRAYVDRQDGQFYLNTMRTTGPARFFELPAADFASMVRSWFPMAIHLIDGLYVGIRSGQDVVRQREKLVALGQMSAGLAHELNNPAGAAARATATLRERVAGMRHKLGKLADGRLNPAELISLVELQEDAVERVAKLNRSRERLTALETGDREDTLADWLDDHGVSGGWDLAPVLVAGGLDVEWADGLAERIGGDRLDGAMRWIAYTVETETLMSEIEEAVGRLSELVGAVKQYTYMDQAPEQDVDVHDGLESTLVMLGHKVKYLDVVRDYDRTLPRIPAHGSQLNQVWTNLIDNAADSVLSATDDGHRGKKGKLTLRTSMDRDTVLVEIADDGPGIAPEALPRIFDAFFTTKGVGKGTGMGLDISNRIVTLTHGGRIDVESRPGETRFLVRLPVGRLRNPV